MSHPNNTIGLAVVIASLFFLVPPTLPADSPDVPKEKGEIILPSGPASEIKSPDSLLKAIEKRASELDARERQIDLREQRLKILENEISEMVRQNSKIRQEVSQTKGERGPARDQQMGRLAKVYESMAPEDAATRIEQMNESLALNLLMRIKDKIAAQILSGMDPEKAARFSEKLARTARRER